MGVPGRATVTRAEYRAYIRYEAGRAVRAHYWASNLPQSGYVCDAPRRPGMHLHYRTYKNLGAERLMDLVAPCRDCHEAVHAVHRADPAAATRGLWETTKRVRKTRRRRAS